MSRKITPQMSTNPTNGFQNQDLISEAYFLGCCCCKTGEYTTKVRHKSVIIQSETGCFCKKTNETLVPYSAIQHISTAFGGCFGGRFFVGNQEFRKIQITTQATGTYYPHVSLINGSDAAEYLMNTIRSAME